MSGRRQLLSAVVAAPWIADGEPGRPDLYHL
jgi:hypothetical protein